MVGQSRPLAPTFTKPAAERRTLPDFGPFSASTWKTVCCARSNHGSEPISYLATRRCGRERRSRFLQLRSPFGSRYQVCITPELLLITMVVEFGKRMRPTLVESKEFRVRR